MELLGFAGVLREVLLGEPRDAKERSRLPVHPLAQYLSEEVLGDQRILRIAGAVT